MKREYDLSKTLDRKTVRTGLLSVTASCCALLMVSCVYNPPYTTGTNNSFQEVKAARDIRALEFNKEFAEALIKADTVVVREHSSAADLENVPNARRSTKFTYIKKQLSFNERMTFVEEVNALKGRARTITTDCLFEPHHSIELYKSGSLISKMEISYDCGEIRWSGSRIPASGDMFDAVTPLLKRSGMKVHRDWKSKAEQKYAENLIDPSGDDQVKNDTAPAVNRTPTAKWVPGEVGKRVINPFTGTPVDVEGIPAGLKVRDPNDSDESHVFRVPAQ